MTDPQWNDLLAVLRGEILRPPPVGFMGEPDFVDFGLPYLRELYDVKVAVKFFHDDAPSARSIRHYPDVDINLYNPGIQTSLTEMRQLSGHRLTILGNVPPRDGLAQGTSDDVRAAMKKLLAEAKDPARLILSCGGGVPPGVPTANLQAFVQAARE